MTTTLATILVEVDTLSQDEQLLLIEHLASRVRQRSQPETPRRQWRDIRGMIPPLDEDAQEWISRMRRESDEQRALTHSFDQLFQTLGITDTSLSSVDSEELQRCMAQSGLEENELSRDLIAMRDE